MYTLTVCLILELLGGILALVFRNQVSCLSHWSPIRPSPEWVGRYKPDRSPNTTAEQSFPEWLQWFPETQFNVPQFMILRWNSLYIRSPAHDSATVTVWLVYVDFIVWFTFVVVISTTGTTTTFVVVADVSLYLNLKLKVRDVMSDVRALWFSWKDDRKWTSSTDSEF